MTIQNFDRAAVNALAAEVTEALRAVAARHGLTYEPGNGKFDPTRFEPRGSFKVAAGPATETAREEFEAYAGAYGLKPEDFGREFVGAGGHAYRIVGLNINRPKNVVRLLRIKDGVLMCAPAVVVRAAILGR